MNTRTYQFRESSHLQRNWRESSLTRITSNGSKRACRIKMLIMSVINISCYPKLSRLFSVVPRSSFLKCALRLPSAIPRSGTNVSGIENVFARGRFRYTSRSSNLDREQDEITLDEMIGRIWSIVPSVSLQTRLFLIPFPEEVGNTLSGERGTISFDFSSLWASRHKCWFVPNEEVATSCTCWLGAVSLPTKRRMDAIFPEGSARGVGCEKVERFHGGPTNTREKDGNSAIEGDGQETKEGKRRGGGSVETK